jgi:hypothetical protein
MVSGWCICSHLAFPARLSLLRKITARSRYEEWVSMSAFAGAGAAGVLNHYATVAAMCHLCLTD